MEIQFKQAQLETANSIVYKASKMIWVTLQKESIYRYPDCAVWISVSEDDKNGAFIQHNSTSNITKNLKGHHNVQ